MKIYIEYNIMSRRRSGLSHHRRAYDYACPYDYIAIGIEYGPGSAYTGGLRSVTIPGTIQEYGNPLIPNVLDDGSVPIPMNGQTFNFFGANYSNNIYWSSNNALLFGTSPTPAYDSDISRNLVPAILLGNYDRMLKSFQYSNALTSKCEITTILVTFYDYYTNPSTNPTYQYKIRLIKEIAGPQHQFVEVYVLSSPPSPGYSTTITNYPSGTVDTNGHKIDLTKQSPYNITNGVQFLNPCGLTFGLTSPPANKSFVFSSDSTGTNWEFTDNAYVAV